MRAERELFGLWVSFGHYSPNLGRWLRLPAARFTCRWGCLFEGSGAEYVAQFTRAIDAHHARHCPGPPTL
ncbi:hypothetical protein [Streptomyces sp. S.PB5]|uniref:hypothetical protein n=1 Tax=Streptomyces sp. S.PB5 TaxID=3020844 RepID=UPI0025B0AA34|nr:hypothetical protein [Streptomyces sp. S.PB5]MDN3021561.1 hypothetical protein [Streptomyces sp. S.PB5]